MKEINNNLVTRAGEHSFEDNATTNKGRLREEIKGEMTCGHTPGEK